MTHQAPSPIDAPTREVTTPQVVAALEFDILFGRLKPRERLIEDGLMSRFGAKRHVVRQALTELERMGIVVRAPNRGASVRDFSAKEVAEIYELRELLQRRAAELLPLPAEPAFIAELKAVQALHDAAVDARSLSEIDRVNDVFHRTLFAACGNAHLVDAISRYAQLTRAMRVFPMTDRAMMARLRAEHWAMIEAIERADRTELVRLVIAHIQPSRIAYLAMREALDL